MVLAIKIKPTIIHSTTGEYTDVVKLHCNRYCAIIQCVIDRLIFTMFMFITGNPLQNLNRQGCQLLFSKFPFTVETNPSKLLSLGLDYYGEINQIINSTIWMCEKLWFIYLCLFTGNLTSNFELAGLPTTFFLNVSTDKNKSLYTFFGIGLLGRNN